MHTNAIIVVDCRLSPSRQLPGEAEYPVRIRLCLLEYRGKRKCEKPLSSESDRLGMQIHSSCTLCGKHSVQYINLLFY